MKNLETKREPDKERKQKNFIQNIRFAQLDVRPALDSAEAVQDRMKVSRDQKISHKNPDQF